MLFLSFLLTFAAPNDKNLNPKKAMSSKTKITVAYGDGIGPEIMNATLAILDAAGAQLEYDVIEIGEKVYLKGISSGMEPKAIDSLRANKVFLKSPITTPQGGGFKSLNVTTRKSFGLYANVRPCKAYAPFIKTHFPKTDLVIIRENEEDLYAGIEHRQTQEVYQCLKVISQPGSEKIIRYAFEYAKKYGRKKVTCMTKDNIMKLADGLFHKTFEEIAKEYPGEIFGVIVTLNLYGDIISDVAAQVTGSVGLGGSANVGAEVAMFEAIHGSAPDIAGKDMANPSGLLNGAIMMLVHIGQPEIAEKISNAWMKTLEDGIHTGDIYQEGLSAKKVGTQEFAQAVIARLGQVPSQMTPASFGKESTAPMDVALRPKPKAKKELIGVDVFLDWDQDNRDPNVLGNLLNKLETGGLKLSLINNRGVKVFPDGMKETFCTEHWRCRFKVGEGETLSHAQVIDLLQKAEKLGLDFIKTEHLYTFDGVKGFSLGQGE